MVSDKLEVVAGSCISATSDQGVAIAQLGKFPSTLAGSGFVKVTH